MLKKMLVAAGITVFMMAGVSFATAIEQKPKLVLKTKVEKESNILKDGKVVEVKSAATNFKRGDRLIYTVTYKNEGTALAKNAIIVDPIPEGTLYLDSAAGKDTDIQFSIDGGNSFQKAPVKYIVAKADGTKESRVATPDMYSHVKWVVTKAIPPGDTGDVNFAVKVK
jgi:uncharacterized repeat protein (TIGR01451 family)